MFNARRLTLARMRRRMTAKGLAHAAGVTPDTITRLEKARREPDPSTVERIAEALGYPAEFFFREDDPADLDATAVSFRSFSRMSAKEKDAAHASGQLGIQLIDWVEQRFHLPDPDLIDMSYQHIPEKAAFEVRQYWGIGERPIGNMIGLLEAKGVRVLSLCENTANVNAFSFWRDGKPYVFLNNFKSPESSIFDCAHELGHLLIHRRGEMPSERNAEREADAFASAFLMPARDIRASFDMPITADVLIRMKLKWRVSAFALLYRLWALKIVATEYQYRSLCIDLSKRGYRSREPVGIEREVSTIWKQVFSALWQEKVTKDEVAAQLAIPLDELEGLVANMTPNAVRPESRALKAV